VSPGGGRRCGAPASSGSSEAHDDVRALAASQEPLAALAADLVWRAATYLPQDLRIGVKRSPDRPQPDPSSYSQPSDRASERYSG
jgi:hypothetical protein